MTYPRIRYATAGDVTACQAVAREHSKMLGFVRLDSLMRGVEKRELFVADVGGEIVGFVNWHGCGDGWSTIYELGVSRAFQGQGIGRMLLYAVPCPIRLKCTVDNSANAFYVNAGMRRTDVKPGRKRALYSYELRVLTVLVQGNNKRMPEIARTTGMAYGVRHIDKPQAWPFMLDVEWNRFKRNSDEWSVYMALVNEYKPVMAMCVDYERPEQREGLQKQIDDLKTAGILRTMVCPKFDGAISDIPQDCIVAISVPSRYAGFLPDLSELRGRNAHLLGGTPQKQRDLMTKIAGHGGHVLSIDGNSHTAAGRFNSQYESGAWRRKPGEPIGDYYDVCRASGNNIRRELNAAAAWSQLPLWGGSDV